MNLCGCAIPSFPGLTCTQPDHHFGDHEAVGPDGKKHILHRADAVGRCGETDVKGAQCKLTTGHPAKIHHF